MKNRLILIEGIPGSGKTTIANKLKEHLVNKGVNVKLYVAFIKEYMFELIDTVKGLNPKLIYLNQESVSETIERVVHGQNQWKKQLLYGMRIMHH